MLLFAFALLASCAKTDDKDGATAIPQISSLTTSKDSIAFGGIESAILTCVASGGALTYKWEVDFGDLLPLNAEGSQIQFTGSECCTGDKNISCTVKNSLGQVTKIVVVNIGEPPVK